MSRMKASKLVAATCTLRSRGSTSTISQVSVRNPALNPRKSSPKKKHAYELRWYVAVDEAWLRKTGIEAVLALPNHPGADTTQEKDIVVWDVRVVEAEFGLVDGLKVAQEILGRFQPQEVVVHMRFISK